MDQSPAARSVRALHVAVNLVLDQWALIAAVENNMPGNVSIYLDKGVPIGTKDTEGNSLLHLAVQAGHVGTMQLLISRGCDVDSVDGKGLTPLHWAAAMGQTNAVKELLAVEANMSVVSNEGVTPLQQAALNRHVEVVIAMLENGCPTDVVDSDRSTVLHYAAQGGHAEIVKLLVDKRCDVNAVDANGCTPLHDAADCGKTEAVCELIKLGAAKSVVAGKFGTPLHRATLEGHVETVAAMLENGCPFDVTDSDGSTVLHVAAEGGHVEVVRKLVDSGCDVNARKENGCTPLHDAAMFGRKDVVCELIKHSAVKSVVAGKYGTPLHQAAIKGNVETVEALLEDDNDSVSTNHNVTSIKVQVHYGLIGICNSVGVTPVMSAVLYGQVEMCKLLISKGGGYTDKDKYSLSAFERSFVSGHACKLNRFCKACGIKNSGEGLKGALVTLMNKGLVDEHKVICLCAISGECVFLEHQFKEMVASVPYKFPEAVKFAKYFFDVGESIPFLKQLQIPDETSLYALHISLLSMKCFSMGFAGPSIQHGANDHTLFITKLLNHPVLKETVNEYFPGGLSPLDLARQFELLDIAALIEGAGGRPGVWANIPQEIANNCLLMQQLKEGFRVFDITAEHSPNFMLRTISTLLHKHRPSLLFHEPMDGSPGETDTSWHTNAMIVGANVGAESENHEFKSLMDDVEPLNNVNDIVKRVSMDTCIRAINAMLNYPKGGIMHFGIGDDGKVEKGLNLEQNPVIDRLRRKIGDILITFSPPVQSHYAQVEAVNLLDDKKVSTLRWRFDIVIKNLNKLVRLHPDGPAYYRQGPQNIVMTPAMLKDWFGVAPVSPAEECSVDGTKYSGKKGRKKQKASRQGKKR